VPKRIPAALTAQRTSRPSRKTSTHKWLRWLHVYTSMISFLVVLFFAVTGVTLNHPTWTFGDDVERITATGTLPAGWQDDPVDFLAVSEYVRATHGISAPVADYGLADGEGTISFRGPGVTTDVFFRTADGSYDVVTVQQGFVGVMNDLHKGRDSASSWKWLIDVSGVFLAVVAFTGLTLQAFLRKRRRSAGALAAVGAIVTVALIVVTTY